MKYTTKNHFQIKPIYLHLLFTIPYYPLLCHQFNTGNSSKIGSSSTKIEFNVQKHPHILFVADTTIDTKLCLFPSSTSRGRNRQENHLPIHSWLLTAICIIISTTESWCSICENCIPIYPHIPVNNDFYQWCQFWYIILER